MKLSDKEKEKKFPTYQYEHTVELGPWTSHSYIHDPLHILFVLARYKFVAKMLSSKKHLLEIGCGDGVGLPLVAHGKERVTALDIDQRILNQNMKRLAFLKNVNFVCMDIRIEKPEQTYDGVFAIDVIEHIQSDVTDNFMRNTTDCLTKDGIYILGTPNVKSKRFASEQSKHFHLNWFDHEKLSTFLEKRFHNVFLFSMNDEVVHTGFFPMAHYLFGMGVGKKE